MAFAKKSKVRDPSYAVKVKGTRKHIAPITLVYRLAQTGEFAGTFASGYQYIDLAQGQSIVQRKLIRQGHCMYVDNVSLVQHYTSEDAGDANAMVTIKTLPNVWAVANAWVMAFSAWNQMRKQVLENQPSLKARWADFKIFMDGGHYALNAAGTTDALPCQSPLGAYVPFTYTSGGSTNGEWEFSEFTLPDHTLGGVAVDFYGHMMGPDNGDITAGTIASAGLLLAYEESRQRVQPDSTDGLASQGMYSNLFDLGGQQEDLTDDIIAENKFPPYDMPKMGNVGQDGTGSGIVQCALQTNQGLPIATSSNDFAVPCSLLRVDWANTSASLGVQMNLLITLRPGKSHGLHLETMGQ